MRILFLESHPMWIHGLPNGFRDMGHEVMVSGVLTDTNIPVMLRSFQPHLIVMMGWTNEHTSKKLSWVLQYVKPTGIPLVFWATEDPTHTESFTLPFIKQTCPDFVFTISPANVGLYQSMGMKAARLDFGYHQSVHHRTYIYECYRCSIAVVANAYPHILANNSEHHRIASLKTLIQPLIKNNIRVDFWGRQWEDMARFLGRSIPAEWLHGYIDYTQANKIYSSADIVLGLQNHTDQLTQRTYEILGSEGFLITSDTPEVRHLFKPGIDLIVSKSPDETIELVDYYVNHPEEREKIRRQGREHVSVHDYKYRAQQMIDTLIQYGILDEQAS